MSATNELPGNRFGTHRVVEPIGTLPQAAWRLDNDLTKLYDNELVIDVERLNIDSASFVQMQSQGDVAAQIGKTVADRGKQHNPVTGSGGMLLGRIARIGSALSSDPRVAELRIGDRVATLVSLSLTPLHLDEIAAVDVARHQVEVRGQAVLFASGAWATLRSELPETAALAALDVAGAAPQVARLVRQGDRVLVLGCGGKSGLLCSAAARRAGAAIVVGVERSEAAAAGARRLGACDTILIADAADAVAVSEAVVQAVGEVDFAVSCVNVADAEMSAILSTRQGGTIYFFSMSTSFTKAALGAEGVSRDVEMIVGNGYCVGHAAATLKLLDEERILRELFVERYG